MVKIILLILLVTIAVLVILDDKNNKANKVIEDNYAPIIDNELWEATGEIYYR